MEPAMTDAELVDRFTERALAASSFGHREHVRLAFAVLARHPDFGVAAILYRRMLRAFATANGAPDRYHETITWAYLAIVRARMEGHAESDAMLAANPDLLDHRHGALARHYDVAAITADPFARRLFVLPEGRAR
jgi:hypothetical protein